MKTEIHVLAQSLALYLHAPFVGQYNNVIDAVYAEGDMYDNYDDDVLREVDDDEFTFDDDVDDEELPLEDDDGDFPFEDDDDVEDLPLDDGGVAGTV